MKILWTLENRDRAVARSEYGRLSKEAPPPVRAIKESQVLDSAYRVKLRSHDMVMNSGTVHIHTPEPNWSQTLAKYEQPSFRKALLHRETDLPCRRGGVRNAAENP
jgi:hypothetical protein